VTCGGLTYALDPGQVHLIPPWVLFHTATTSTQIQRYCHFVISDAATQHLSARQAKPLSVPAEPWLSGAIAAWTSVMEQSHPDVFLLHGWAALVVEAALLQAYAHHAGNRHNPPSTLASAALQPAIEAIEQRPEDPPSNAELAALCGLGPDHFLRQFRAHCGVTPGQYRLERRLRLAAEMLVADDRPLDAIAAATGFSDRFYLSRMFTRRMGQGPAAYRRMHRRETR
jgi:AraC-like DNA-binding protein